MIYITAENDTLRDLRQKVGCPDSLEMFETRFARANFLLCLKNPMYRFKLPPYSVIHLSQPPPFTYDTELDEIVNELNGLSLNKRKKLRMLQESEDEKSFVRWMFFYDISKKVQVEKVVDEDSQSTSGISNKDVIKGAKLVQKVAPSVRDLVDEKLASTRNADKLSSIIKKIEKSNQKLDVIKHNKTSSASSARKAIQEELQKQLNEVNKLLQEELEQFEEKLFTKDQKKIARRTANSQLSRLSSGSYRSGREAGRFIKTLPIEKLSKNGLRTFRNFAREMEEHVIDISKSKFFNTPLATGLKKLFSSKNLSYIGVALETYEDRKSTDINDPLATALTGLVMVEIMGSAVAACGGMEALGGFVLGVCTFIPVASTIGASVLSTPVGICLIIIGSVFLWYVSPTLSQTLRAEIYKMLSQPLPKLFEPPDDMPEYLKNMMITDFMHGSEYM